MGVESGRSKQVAVFIKPNRLLDRDTLNALHFINYSAPKRGCIKLKFDTAPLLYYFIL